jgi:hypothetical protein
MGQQHVDTARPNAAEMSGKFGGDRIAGKLYQIYICFYVKPAQAKTWSGGVLNILGNPNQLGAMNISIFISIPPN